MNKFFLVKARFHIGMLLILLIPTNCISQSGKESGGANKTTVESGRGKQSYAKSHPESNIMADVIATGLGQERHTPIYGFNGANIRGEKWSNPELMQKIKSIPLKIIRYPGGNNANWWDWRTGWFVKSDQLPANFRNVQEKVVTGLPELKEFVEQTNCEVLFVLNILTSTLEEQIAMLKQAQQMGIPVKWIELGNELNYPENPGNKVFRNGMIYGQKIRNWVTRIKSEFPTAKVAVLGGNRNAKQELKNWNEEVLGQNIQADALAWHAYPATKNGIVKDDGIDYRQLNKTILATFNGVGMNRINSKHEIWVTEYNIQWSILDASRSKPEVQKFATSWGQALSSLLMTSTISVIAPNVSMVINHNLTIYPTFAAIETFPNKTFDLLPNGMAMQVWLNSVKGMSDMRKINFTESGKPVEDYLLFGWQFSAGNEKKYLLVNLQNKKHNIDISKIISAEADTKAYFANKNVQTRNWANITIENGKIIDGLLEVQPYSITTIN